MSRTKTRLLGNVSHELRTPLHGILCSAELLLDPRAGLCESDRTLVATIAECGRAQLQMVERLLDFAALELRDGGGARAAEPVALPSLLREVETVAGALSNAKGLRLHVAADPVVCLINGLAVKQVLLNLLGNAVKYTPSGFVSCEVRVRDGLLRGSVTDSGIGVPEDSLEKIFLPFYQGRSEGQRSGVGLGLAITRTQVMSMGGTIVAKRRDGGSEFVFEIPATVVGNTPAASSVPVPSPSSVAAVAPAPAGEGEKQLTPVLQRACRVLVVDDVAMNRTLLRRFLSKAMPNTTVIEAEDGCCAMKVLDDAAKFDLIFCDWLMPFISGEEVAWLLRKRERASSLPRTPIVCLSAAVSAQSKVAMTECGMDAILQKPLTLEALKGCIEKILGEDDETESDS